MDKLEITYSHFDSLCELPTLSRELIDVARSASLSSYSPYSHFAVGAAARLKSGVIVRGANIESEVYPAGICAERNLLFHSAAYYPNDPITQIAIISSDTNRECYPCGVCRQSLLDAERRQGSPIQIVMACQTSATVVESAATLLPFAFKL